ncbi:hypothetical protein HZ326_18214 [Fusarium oxysporum f. sp. albedinis]|nr:hypothetical protein HZ326_18214 [Fusarium oxysporum f. sp. albedinis]
MAGSSANLSCGCTVQEHKQIAHFNSFQSFNLTQMPYFRVFRVQTRHMSCFRFLFICTHMLSFLLAYTLLIRYSCSQSANFILFKQKWQINSAVGQLAHLE